MHGEQEEKKKWKHCCAKLGCDLNLHCLTRGVMTWLTLFTLLRLLSSSALTGLSASVYSSAPTGLRTRARARLPTRPLATQHVVLGLYVLGICGLLLSLSPRSLVATLSKIFCPWTTKNWHNVCIESKGLVLVFKYVNYVMVDILWKNTRRHFKSLLNNIEGDLILMRVTKWKARHDRATMPRQWH